MTAKRPPSSARKLTPEQVQAIRDNPLPAEKLAPYYGVTRKTIWLVRQGQTYRDLETPK